MNRSVAQRGQAAPVVVSAIAVGIIAAFAGYWYGTHRHEPTPSPVAAAAANGTGEKILTDETGRKVLYWHDPMVPGHRFDKPGKSPFMDMQLVPVYADAGADEGKVTISPRLAQSFGVRTVEAKPGSLASGFTAVGAIAVDERTIVGVQSRVDAFVERLHVRATFDGVRAGQPIAELFVPDWIVAQEELLALKLSTQPGTATLIDAARNRLRLLGMPDAEIERVEREGKTSGRVTVTAPQGGIVWEIGARDGMKVMPGTNLIRIAGLGSVWLVAEVPEAQAAQLAVGRAVEARADAFPDRVFKGTVQALLPEVNTATRTVRARIVLANPGGALKPGMFANASFKAPDLKAAVLVPTEAVIRTGARDVVIVAHGEGKFAPVEVEVGRESGDMTELRKGVTAGQRVVVSSQFLIDSEASLKGVLSRMNAPEKAPADPRAGHGSASATGPVKHKGVGTIRDIDASMVMLEHEAIPSAGMGAMTMGYNAPSGGLPKGLKDGMRVEFEFVMTPKGEFELTTIAPQAGPAKVAKGGAR